MPGHTWQNGLWPLKHSHPGLSQVPGTGISRWTSSKGCVATMFLRELWAAWLWRQGRGSISQCVLLPEQPWKAWRTCHTWDWACTPGPSGQPHHGILWEQPPSAQLAGPTEGRSPQTPWGWPTCTGYPVWAIDGYTSTCTDWLQVGMLLWNGLSLASHPAV